MMTEVQMLTGSQKGRGFAEGKWMSAVCGWLDE